MELSLADADSYSAETLARIRQNLGTDMVLVGSYVTVGEGNDATFARGPPVAGCRARETNCAQVSETSTARRFVRACCRALAARCVSGLVAVRRTDAAGGGRARPTSNPEAIRLYAEGLTRLRRFDALGRAIRSCSDATEAAFNVRARTPGAGERLVDAGLRRRGTRRGRAGVRALSELAAGRSAAGLKARYREMSSEWKEAIAIWQQLCGVASPMMWITPCGWRTTQMMSGRGERRPGQRGLPAPAFPRCCRTIRASISPSRPRPEALVGLQANALHSRSAAGAAREGARCAMICCRRQAAARASSVVFGHGGHSDIGQPVRGGTAHLCRGRRPWGRRACTQQHCHGALADGPDTQRTVALYEEVWRLRGRSASQARHGEVPQEQPGELSEPPRGRPSRPRSKDEPGIAGSPRELGTGPNVGHLAQQHRQRAAGIWATSRARWRNYEQSAAIAREIGMKAQVANALGNMANLLLPRGELSARTQALRGRARHHARNQRQDDDGPKSGNLSLVAVQTRRCRGRQKAVRSSSGAHPRDW